MKLQFTKWLLNENARETVNIPEFGNIQFICRSDKVLVMISVKKLNELWKKDFKGFYIPPGAGKNDQRCKNIVEFIKTGEPLQAPEILVGGFKQTFHDGRHRFAVLRDAGASQIPIAVKEKYAKQVQLELGV